MQFAASTIKKKSIEAMEHIAKEAADDAERAESCRMITDAAVRISGTFFRKIDDHYKYVCKDDPLGDELNDRNERLGSVGDMLFAVGDAAEHFSQDAVEDQEAKDICADCACAAWKEGMTVYSRAGSSATGDGNVTGRTTLPKDVRSGYVSKIREYDPEYSDPIGKSGGCFVATAVYGSYDCPQVRTLRRYRDTVLYPTWYGRAFIRVYYAMSPALVRRFGQSRAFAGIFRPLLDRITAGLNRKGISGLPYDDLRM